MFKDNVTKLMAMEVDPDYIAVVVYARTEEIGKQWVGNQDLGAPIVYIAGLETEYRIRGLTVAGVVLIDRELNYHQTAALSSGMRTAFAANCTNLVHRVSEESK